VFYSLLKGYARLAIKIYCPRIIINRPEVLKAHGPLLLAANHPNSFLDGMILTTLFDQPVHSLARGDAFRQPRTGRLLRWLRLLPVYRTSEGVHNLEHNYTTFAACRQTFGAGGIVLIFSEGRCENEWHLRPLKKGTARLALTSWHQGIPLQVLPTAFNYSSFGLFGKELHLYFGTPLDPQTINNEEGEGKKLLAFNNALNSQLRQLVYELDPNDKAAIHAKFPARKDVGTYLLLPIAALGWLLHAPLYYSCRAGALRFRSTGHYDSVLVTLLLLFYPIYLLLLLILSCLFFSWWGFLTLLLPLTARACVLIKRAFNR
jgi:1-acyl-sn-glycerol-3-phosphate acyltransferase